MSHDLSPLEQYERAQESRQLLLHRMRGEKRNAVVMGVSATEVQLWIHGFGMETLALRDVLGRISDSSIGRWVVLQFPAKKDGRYGLSMPQQLENILPVVHVDRELVQVTVNFVPLTEYLYPPAAREKNFVLAATRELGKVPIVFKNQLLHHRFYKGVMVISLRKTDAELRIETIYRTPWLLKRSNNFALVDENEIRQIYKQHIGLVVGQDVDRENFLLFNEVSGLLRLKQSIAEKENIHIGDWIRFVKMDLEDPEETLALLPTKVDEEGLFALPQIRMIDNSIEIWHKITIGEEPAHWGVYPVAHLGEVSDRDGLITSRLTGRQLDVRSRCRVDRDGTEVSFVLEQVLTPIPANNSDDDDDPFGDDDEPMDVDGGGPWGRKEEEKNGGSYAAAVGQPLGKPIVIPAPPAPYPQPAVIPIDNTIECEAIVVAVGAGFSLCFSSDVAVRSSFLKLTPEFMNPLPKVGDFLTLTMRYTDPTRIAYHKSVAYTLEAATRAECPFPTRVIDAKDRNNPHRRLEIRVPLTVNSAHELYSPRLGKVSNRRHQLEVTDARLTKQVKLWCANVENNVGWYWEVATNAQPKWEPEKLASPVAPTSVVVEPAAPVAAATPYRFFGTKYRTNPDPTATVPRGPELVNGLIVDNVGSRKPSSGSPHTVDDYSLPNMEEVAEYVQQHPAPITPPQEEGNPHTAYEPSESSTSPPKKKMAASRQLDMTPEKEAVLVNISPAKSTAATAAATNNIAQEFGDVPNGNNNNRQQANAAVEWEQEGDGDFRNTSVMVGVVASHVKTGFYVYSDSSPDKEAFLPANLAKEFGTVKHGDWIIFKAMWDRGGLYVNSYKIHEQDKRVRETQTTKNSVKLIISADVPMNYDPKEHRRVHSGFVKSIEDSNNLIRKPMLGARIEIVAVRSRLGNVDVPWHIAQILSVKPATK